MYCSNYTENAVLSLFHAVHTCGYDHRYDLIHCINEKKTVLNDNMLFV